MVTPCAEYNNIHYAARKLLKTACERCGGSGIKLEAALRPDIPPGRLKLDISINSLYSLSVEDYFTLCIPCHRYMDFVELRTHCKRGHEYTPENTSWKKGAGHRRRCLTCHRQNEKHRLSDPVKLEAKRLSQRVNRKPLTPEQKARKLELQRMRRQAARQ